MDLSNEESGSTCAEEVPGTHDVGRMREVIAGLRAGKRLSVPRFDKGLDDAGPEAKMSLTPS